MKPGYTKRYLPLSHNWFQSTVKRSIDVIISAALLIVLSPIMSFLALAIKLDSSGPIFYRQKRLGYKGKIFSIIKFRSMSHRLDRKPGEAGELLRTHSEITRIGRWIRRLKIDELPQIIPVLFGDMSLIGPRPMLPDQLGNLDEDSSRRLLVKPGISGLGQVNGNIHLSWQERWQYDVWYVDHFSLSLDFNIFIKTLLLIVYGEEKFYCPFEQFKKIYPT